MKRLTTQEKERKVAGTLCLSRRNGLISNTKVEEAALHRSRSTSSAAGRGSSPWVQMHEDRKCEHVSMRCISSDDSYFSSKMGDKVLI